jgi:hypothetical protein
MINYTELGVQPPRGVLRKALFVCRRDDPETLEGSFSEAQSQVERLWRLRSFLSAISFERSKEMAIITSVFSTIHQ